MSSPPKSPRSPKKQQQQKLYPRLDERSEGDVTLNASSRSPSGSEKSDNDNSFYRTSLSFNSSASSTPERDTSLLSHEDPAEHSKTRSGNIYKSPPKRPAIRTKNDDVSPQSAKSSSFTAAPKPPSAKPRQSASLYSAPGEASSTTKRGQSPEKPDATDRRYKPYIEEAEDDPNRDISMLFFFAMGVIVVVCVTLFRNLTNSEVEKDVAAVPGPSQRDLMVESFSVSLRDMRDTFPSQSKRFWAMLAAPTKAVLRSEEPRQPAIIVLVGTSSALDTTLCLESKLSKIISESYKAKRGATRLAIDKSLLAMSHSDLKLKIDDEFKMGFGAGGHVAVLRNLNQVPGKAAMMFHAYCDNESAPFKDAAILFTVELGLSDQEVNAMEDNEIARVVEEQLSQKWTNEIGLDNTMALLSRVANNVAVVKQESTDILNKNKCY